MIERPRLDVHGVERFEGVLGPEECAEYVRWTESIGYDLAPITTAHGFAMRPDIRNNTRVIVDDRPRAEALWRRVVDLLPERMTIGRGVWQAVGLNERFRFYRYTPGQRFAWHRDGAFVRDEDERSLLTFMIYLNDDLVGGETLFQGLTVAPKRGAALVFLHGLLHEGAEVRDGTKYVLRSDVMYRRVVSGT